jgi:hypothetical protein
MLSRNINGYLFISIRSQTLVHGKMLNFWWG